MPCRCGNTAGIAASSHSVACWTEWVHVSSWFFFFPSPFPLSFHLITLCDYFFICFILFVWWVLKGKKWTQSCSWFLGVCLGWGREHGEKSFFKKKKSKKNKTWTCVKSCIIYEICIKEQCTSGTINNYSIFESVLLNNVIFPSWEYSLCGSSLLSFLHFFLFRLCPLDWPYLLEAMVMQIIALLKKHGWRSGCQAWLPNAGISGAVEVVRWR